MGFKDKLTALGSVGINVQKIDKKITTSIEEIKLNETINNENGKIVKNHTKLGELYFNKTMGVAENFDEDSKKVIADIKECLQAIERAKREKAEIAAAKSAEASDEPANAGEPAEAEEPAEKPVE